MVVGFTTTYAISVYHHYRCVFESRSWQGVLDTTLCDKVCQWLTAGRLFSPVSSTNKTNGHDITEILLKVTLNTITPNSLSFKVTELVLYKVPRHEEHKCTCVRIKIITRRSLQWKDNVRTVILGEKTLANDRITLLSGEDWSHKTNLLSRNYSPRVPSK
jgi:hypothetical protein